MRRGPGTRTAGPARAGPGSALQARRYGVLTGSEEQTLAGWLPVILQMAAVM
jgi:hypothetical protein